MLQFNLVEFGGGSGGGGDDGGDGDGDVFLWVLNIPQRYACKWCTV
jgi:hypothetical protein